MCNGKPSPPDGVVKSFSHSENTTHSLSCVLSQTSQKRATVLSLPLTSGGFLLAFPVASCLHPLPWVSEMPFCPLLSLHAYVFFPWKFSFTFEIPVPDLLVPKSVPAPELLAGDLKYCLIPRTNPEQNVELGRAPSSSPQVLAAEVPGFSLPQIKADLWPEAEIPFHSSESNR